MVDQTTSIKEINRIRILNLLRLYPGASRIELVKKTGLTKGAVSSLVADLLHEGLIQEVGAGVQLAATGRPPIQLQLKAGTHLAIGIELTGTRCVSVLADLYSKPLREIRCEVTDTSVDGLSDLVSHIVDELMAGYPVSKLLGVGVGVPAIVDKTGYKIIRSENTGLSGVPLGDILTQRVGNPVTLVKRQEAGALGEYRYGIGKGCQNLAFISIDVGIGCGVLLGGKLYEGADGYAGEIGHVIVADCGESVECRCGNYGCLETVASLPSMAAQARAKIESGQASSLDARDGGDLSAITGRSVINAAQQGDALSIQVVQDAAGHVGKVVSTMVSLLNLSLVVFSGEMAELGDLFFGPIQEAVCSRAYPASSQSVEIVSSALGNQAAAIGAATLVIDRFFTPAVPGLLAS